MGIVSRFKPPFSRRQLVALVLGLAALGGGGAYYLGWLPGTAGDTAQAGPPGGPGGPGGKRKGPGGPPRLTPVKATQVKTGDLDVVLAALGTVTASNTATVKPRVDGQLIRLHFREGQMVKSGDLLAEIDPRPFQVQLDQVKGQLQKDEALLSAARVDLERYRGLLAKDSIARQQVETQEALVRQYQGVVETDRAQVANARLQLDFTRITAPASGRLGLRQVDVGNNVRASDTTGLVVITQTQPIYVVFAIPAEGLGDVVGRLQGGKPLSVEAWHRDGRTLLTSGKLLGVDNQIDVTTGTVKLKAEFANADNSLFPNQFVNARLKVETRRDALLLANAAVQRNAQGPFVFVIKPDTQTVEQRPIVLGPVNGDQVVVEQGLKAGEQVVLDGADRLQAGSKVEVLALDGRSVAGDSPAEPRRGPRPEGAPEVKPDTKPETKPEAKPEKKPEGKPAEAAAPAPAPANPGQAGEGPTPEQRERWRQMRERGEAPTPEQIERFRKMRENGELTPEQIERMRKYREQRGN